MRSLRTIWVNDGYNLTSIIWSDSFYDNSEPFKFLHGLIWPEYKFSEGELFGLDHIFDNRKPPIILVKLLLHRQAQRLLNRALAPKCFGNPSIEPSNITQLTNNPPNTFPDPNIKLYLIGLCLLRLMDKIWLDVLKSKGYLFENVTLGYLGLEATTVTDF